MTCYLFLHFTDALSSLLWNLHKYYSQFSDCVQSSIMKLRQPIEKELKVDIVFLFYCVPVYWNVVQICQTMHELEHSVWCKLLPLGLCQDLQMERCQFLGSQTISWEDPSVRPNTWSDLFASVGLTFCSRTLWRTSFPLYSSLFSTLFKFVKKFEEALSSPSVAFLVDPGNSACLESIDANPEETPIHRIHQALKNAPPGKGRDLQVLQKKKMSCQMRKLFSSIFSFHLMWTFSCA